MLEDFRANVLKRSFCAVDPCTERACPFRNIKKVRSFGIYRVHRAPHLNGKQNFRPLVTSALLLPALSSEENDRPLNLRIALTALDKKRELKNS